MTDISHKLISYLALVAFSLLLLLPADAWAQSDRDRTAEEAPAQRPIAHRMHDVIADIEIRNAPARDVLKWWSQSTGIPLVVHWNKLKDAGVEPDREITIEMKHLPVYQVLELVLDEMSDDLVPVTYQTTQWYVQVLTQQQADRNVVRRVYPVDDLLFQIPNFTNAPRLGLTEALEGSSGENSSREGIFEDEEDNEDELDARSSKAARGEELAQLIRDTITPHLWRAHGGEYSSVQYLRGMLIVVAPVYVHQKIGSAGFGARPPQSSSGPAVPAGASRANTSGSSTGVASVQKHEGTKTSGVAK